MGPFWSLRSVAGQNPHVRLGKKDITTPYTTSLAVINKHVMHDDLNDCSREDLIVSRSDLERSYMADHVLRIPVEEGRLRGTLFLPRGGEGKFPGVLDLFGNVGGLAEHRAALLASRGFATLALAYYKYKDLPLFPGPLELEYFVEAIDWLQSQPVVRAGGIGGVGISKGANILLAVASYTNALKCVVSISSPDRNLYTDYTYQGKVYPGGHPTEPPVEEPDGSIRMQKPHEGVTDYQRYQIPVEKARSTNYLLIHGVDDQTIDISNATRLIARLNTHDKANYEAHLYSGAGHIIEPPYSPACSKAFHPGYKRLNCYGGRTLEHSLAQADAWQKTLRFLDQHLA